MDFFELSRQEFLEECRKVARKHAQQYGQVTIDDVREQISLPQGMNGKVFGAVFAGKEWKHSGFTRTRRESSHSRTIGVYKLQDLIQSVKKV